MVHRMRVVTTDTLLRLSRCEQNMRPGNTNNVRAFVFLWCCQGWQTHIWNVLYLTSHWSWICAGLYPWCWKLSALLNFSLCILIWRRIIKACLEFWLKQLEREFTSSNTSYNSICFPNLKSSLQIFTSLILSAEGPLIFTQTALRPLPGFLQLLSLVTDMAPFWSLSNSQYGL